MHKATLSYILYVLFRSILLYYVVEMSQLQTALVHVDALEGLSHTQCTIKSSRA